MYIINRCLSSTVRYSNTIHMFASKERLVFFHLSPKIIKHSFFFALQCIWPVICHLKTPKKDIRKAPRHALRVSSMLNFWWGCNIGSCAYRGEHPQKRMRPARSALIYFGTRQTRTFEAPLLPWDLHDMPLPTECSWCTGRRLLGIDLWLDPVVEDSGQPAQFISMLERFPCGFLHDCTQLIFLDTQT